MSVDYAWEKLHNAVCSLASGTDRLQKRLEYAGETVLRLEPHDVPIEIQDTLIYIQATLKGAGPYGETGAVENTTRQMSDEEAAKLADEIVGLFAEVAGLVGPIRAELGGGDKEG